ncbi:MULTISPECIES: hypothetical protein [Rhodococcus]|uniref:Uncharacterized protein n=1 Tax=Rhodococcus oxybenzonivorans TaxID=1990687 RepID=A0AAE5A6F6_9NOCA|nr:MULTISPECIES: hypothetical protein [Rhodococcus]MDV7243457.1 hypothetical protein [Rhodococcus oxybenzonivorans]MDV7265163.1 hypothetical protein [Rhodococcus oxybenzonivorans]MDV7277433.1 hypothetical protein [Rhodococcus oxybenzonivorans]MDV7335539.1 hypothetical protein [Rhodococcus oxybenzonivorans]MDV7347145.1 hypothetical protein [Rhodococcus oxybenzonivorans]
MTVADDRRARAAAEQYTRGALSFEDALTRTVGHPIERATVACALEYLASLGALQPQGALSQHDSDLLDDAGFTDDGERASLAVALGRAQTMTDLRRTALTASDVADLLKVKAPRVRQLTSIERKLWVLDDIDKRGRLYPKAQFTDTGMVPYLDHILPRLPRTLHPLTVHAVLTVSREDLTVDGHPASVVEFLTSAATEKDLPDVLEVVERATSLG